MTCGHCKKPIPVERGEEVVWTFEASTARYSGEYGVRVDVFRLAAGVACSRPCLVMLLSDAATTTGEGPNG